MFNFFEVIAVWQPIPPRNCSLLPHAALCCSKQSCFILQRTTVLTVPISSYLKAGRVKFNRFKSISLQLYPRFTVFSPCVNKNEALLLFLETGAIGKWVIDKMVAWVITSNKTEYNIVLHVFDFCLEGMLIRPVATSLRLFLQESSNNYLCIIYLKINQNSVESDAYYQKMNLTSTKA